MTLEPRTVIVNPPQRHHLAYVIVIVSLALAALIGVIGLTSAASDARVDAKEARARLAAQTLEQRCRANAAFDVARATGALLAGFSRAFEGEVGDRAAIRAQLVGLRTSLDEAIAAQQQALTNCKENP